MNGTVKIAEALKAEYPIRLELHAHTKPVSSCAEIPTREVLQIFKDDGYNGIAITNHLYILPDTDVEKYAEMYKASVYNAKELGEKLGIKVYAGAEIRFVKENNNDYLLYGYDPEELLEICRLLETDLESFVRNYKTDEMFLVQAHPFRDNMQRIHPELLDGYEAFNMHPNHNARISLAVKFAEEKGKIMTMGTDFHHPNHDNLCATRTPYLPKDEKELVTLLKSSDFIFEVGGKLVI